MQDSILNLFFILWVFLGANIVLLLVTFVDSVDFKRTRRILIELFIELFIILCSFIIWLISAIMVTQVDWKVSNEPIEVKSIVALNDTSEVSGRIYLHGGTISEVQYYYYLADYGEAGIKLEKVEAACCSLYEVESFTYRIETWEKHRSWGVATKSEIFYKIYIPEGSITGIYQIDLE